MVLLFKVPYAQKSSDNRQGIKESQSSIYWKDHHKEPKAYDFRSTQGRANKNSIYLTNIAID